MSVRGDRRARGFIVVAVLWILAALSAMVLIYLTYVTNTAVVVANGPDRVQGEALVAAGVELAAFQLSSVRESARRTSGTFNARLGAGRVGVIFRSEAARIDLNAAPKNLLAGLFVGLGASPSDAVVYADHIIAWRTLKQADDSDPENSFYRTSGVPYSPRHAPFPLAEELWLVQGIPSLLIEKALPFVTVFSNVAAINVADAAPQVLAALPGITPAGLQELLALRADPNVDPRTLRAAAGSGSSATLDGSKAYRLTVDALSATGVRTTADVIILITEDDAEPYRVLSWHNAGDGGEMPQRAVSR